MFVLVVLVRQGFLLRPEVAWSSSSAVLLLVVGARPRPPLVVVMVLVELVLIITPQLTSSTRRCRAGNHSSDFFVDVSFRRPRFIKTIKRRKKEQEWKSIKLFVIRALAREKSCDMAVVSVLLSFIL